MSKTFRSLADLVQADIAHGRLRPGDRLPTQRAFADAHGVAASTATRVFDELTRRGLVVGEVGRGTFVRTGPPTSGFALSQGIGTRVNLATTLPILSSQAALLAAAAAPLARRTSVIAAAMEMVSARGTEATRQAVAAFAGRDGWRPDPDTIIFTGNGRQALAAALITLIPAGRRLGVEALSYQSVTGIASRLGFEVVPLPMDGHGVTPHGIEAANRRGRLHAIYLQPTMHNPLGLTMPITRRHQVARVLRERGLVAIEDHVLAFLVDDPSPLARIAPDHVVMIDSLSKRVSPGITLGWAIAPSRIVPDLAEAARAGALTPAGLALELSVRWMSDGTVAQLMKDKRRDAARRQRLLRKTCPRLTIHADPRGYHAWVELPQTWRTESFTSAAADLGIAVAPATAFTIGPGHAPNAIRIALASPPINVLTRSLAALDRLIHTGPTSSPAE
jgi:DNA-binding transcriptional MocR family regulator